MILLGHLEHSKVDCKGVNPPLRYLITCETSFLSETYDRCEKWERCYRSEASSVSEASASWGFSSSRCAKPYSMTVSKKTDLLTLWG